MAEGRDGATAGSDRDPQELTRAPVHGAVPEGGPRLPSQLTDTLTVRTVEAPLVSVVMVTHGGGETALEAIEALIENTKRAVRADIVDNASGRRNGGAAAGAHRRARRSSRTRTTSASPEARTRGGACAPGAYLCFLNAGCVRPAGLASAAARQLRARRVSRGRGAALPPPGRPCPGGRLGARLRGAALAIGDGDDPERVRASVPATDRLRLRRLPRRTGRPLRRSRRLRSRLHARLLRGRRPLLQARGARASSPSSSPTARVVHLRGGGSPRADGSCR